MTTFDEAMAMLDEGEIDAIDRLTKHLAAQDQELITNLIRMRKAAGLTQADLAAAWGRHKTAVSQFEQLGNDPRLSTIRRYAASIGASYAHYVHLVADGSTAKSVTATTKVPVRYADEGPQESGWARSAVSH